MPDPAGYSGTPLVRKLGLRPGMRVRLLDAPAAYWEILGGEPEALGVLLHGGDGPVEFTHLFATRAQRLRELFALARKGMADDGLVWASWPKKAAGIESEVSRAEVFDAGHAVGLVDIKVAAVDASWSGLEFVIPRAARRKS